MATNNPEGKKVVRIHRVAIGTNVIVQIVALFFILAGINYIAFKHFRRWDYSMDHKYALSDVTKRMLENLQKPLKFYVCCSRDPQVKGGDVVGDVGQLLREYQYAAHGKVDVELVDEFGNMSRAKELMAKYKFGNENVVVIDYQGHTKLVNLTDMAEYDTSGEMYNKPPVLKSFKGEQVLTAAVMEVTEGKKNDVYLVTGKGGPQLDNNDLALLKLYMNRQNIEFVPLTLMNIEKIPDDAKAVLLFGAKYDLTDRELKLLQDYWDKQGRLLIALDPAGNTPKLAAFLRGAGINPQDDRVLGKALLGNSSFIIRDIGASFSETSPITKELHGVATVFSGQTQSLAVSQMPLVRAESLVTAASGYWGETKYQDMETTGVSFDPKEDISPPLTLAASSEKGALSDASVHVETSRMVVIGNGDFVTTQALAKAEPNVDFVMAGLNWLLNREELIGINPKDEQQFTLSISEEQMDRIRFLTMAVMPVAVLMIGTFVWMRRRR